MKDQINTTNTRLKYMLHKNSSFSILLSALLMAATAGADEIPPGKAGTAGPFAPPTESKEVHEKRIQWWREARFGMFIHWGLYAVPGGTWKDKVRDTGYSEWIMYGEKIPAKEYAKLADKFNPVKFDAKAWTGIAKKAGMKYMVLTTKHHECSSQA
jgi:alpha-L-fucosidase